MSMVTDGDEIRFGITIADLAHECGVANLVYSSVASVVAGVRAPSAGRPYRQGCSEARRYLEYHRQDQGNVLTD